MMAVANRRHAVGVPGNAKPQLGESADSRRAGAQRSRAQASPRFGWAWRLQTAATRSGFPGTPSPSLASPWILAELGLSAPGRRLLRVSAGRGGCKPPPRGRCSRERQAPAWPVCGFSPSWGSALPGGGSSAFWLGVAVANRRHGTGGFAENGRMGLPNPQSIGITARGGPGWLAEDGNETNPRE
jgi:hypothetical protein